MGLDKADLRRVFFGLMIAFGTANCSAKAICDSSSKIIDSTSNILVKQKFKQGKPCGNWSYYTLSTSKIIKKEFYKKGALQYTYLYNEKGQLIESIDKKGVSKIYEPCNCKG